MSAEGYLAPGGGRVGTAGVVLAYSKSPTAKMVWPVPPLTAATVPVTLAALPVVVWFKVGMSAATKARNVGAPAAPLGAA